MGCGRTLKISQEQYYWEVTSYATKFFLYYFRAWRGILQITLPPQPFHSFSEIHHQPNTLAHKNRNNTYSSSLVQTRSYIAYAQTRLPHNRLINIQFDAHIKNSIFLARCCGKLLHFSATIGSRHYLRKDYFNISKHTNCEIKSDTSNTAVNKGFSLYVDSLALLFVHTTNR